MASPDGAYEGNLGDATDQEWLDAHEKLVQLLEHDDSFPNEELSFIWDPELDPATLIDDDEVDHGPEVDNGSAHEG